MARKRPSRGSRHLVEAQGLTAHGEGTGRLGRDELIAGELVPGEQAEVVITHVGQRLFGRVARREVTDPARRSPPCPRQGACQGCPLMGVGEDRQRSLKRAWLGSFGLDVAAIEHDHRPLAYRWSSKRVVGGKRGALVLGSYRRRSHEVADMAGCRVDHPAFDAICEAIAAFGDDLGLPPYSPEDPHGLRYVWLKTNGEATLVTLIAGQVTPVLLELAGGIEATTVAVGARPNDGNAITADDLEVVRGPSTVRLSLAGGDVDIGPMGFLQPNPPVAEQAYLALVGEAAGKRALDLYAGAGLTTELLRARFDEVRPCETHPASAERLGVLPRRARVFLGAEEATPDLVIANPPRSGMGAEVCDELARLRPPRIHIMSCHPRSLSADLQRLKEAAYDVVALMAYDTLPQTMHVELVAHLARR